MSNSNWLQKFLFWTNWIQRSQRLKFDWSAFRTQKKYSYLYIVQVLFKSFFCSFVKVWFSCCIATFAQNIFFESTEMMFLNIWKKMLLYDVKNVFSKDSRAENQELELDVLNYWWSLIFDDFDILMIQYWLIWFNCYCFCNWSDQRYVKKCFVFDIWLDVSFTWWFIFRFDWLVMTNRVRQLSLFFLRWLEVASLVVLAMIYSKKDWSSSQRWFVWIEWERREFKIVVVFDWNWERKECNIVDVLNWTFSRCLVALKTRKMQYRRRAQW